MRFFKIIYYKILNRLIGTKPGQRFKLGDRQFILVNKVEWYPPGQPGMKAVVCRVFDPDDKRSHRLGAVPEIKTLEFLTLVPMEEII